MDDRFDWVAPETRTSMRACPVGMIAVDTVVGVSHAQQQFLRACQVYGDQFGRVAAMHHAAVGGFFAVYVHFKRDRTRAGLLVVHADSRHEAFGRAPQINQERTDGVGSEAVREGEAVQFEGAAIYGAAPYRDAISLLHLLNIQRFEPHSVGGQFAAHEGHKRVILVIAPEGDGRYGGAACGVYSFAGRRGYPVTGGFAAPVVGGASRRGVLRQT